jgi:hypothetical protein
MTSEIFKVQCILVCRKPNWNKRKYEFYKLIILTIAKHGIFKFFGEAIKKYGRLHQNELQNCAIIQ